MKPTKHSLIAALLAVLSLSACNEGPPTNLSDTKPVNTKVCYYQTSLIWKAVSSADQRYSVLDGLIFDYGVDFIDRGDIGNVSHTGQTPDTIKFVVTRGCPDSFPIAVEYKNALDAGLKTRAPYVEGLGDPVSVTQDVYEKG